MDSSDINASVEAISTKIKHLSSEIRDEETRKKLLGILMQATAELESPVETIWKMIMSPHAPAALMVMIQLGVVHNLVQAGKPKTAKELAADCDGDEMLIVRMMRPLVALGIFCETTSQTYESTPISEALVAPPLTGGYQFMFDLATRSLANLPRYLERSGYKNVTQAPGPFEDSNNTEDGMFPYLIKHPSMMTNFNVFMSGSLETRPDWFKTFSAQDIVLDGAQAGDGDSVLLVDIGGGEGHDIEAFQRAFPDAPGALVLQDTAPVIENIKSLSPTVVRQKHDFFQPQPVHGARAYYFRNIFHDWPDHSCVEILKHIAAAMTRGYSKLIIFEWILPSINVPLYPSLLDINMMALLNGMERTEDQWTALLGQAGLKVAKFHTVSAEAEGLIEAELM